MKLYILLTNSKYQRLFGYGFLQVYLVVLNTYFISKENYLFVGILSFGISYLWTGNIKRISISNNFESVVYSIGATLAGLLGLLTATTIKGV